MRRIMDSVIGTRCQRLEMSVTDVAQGQLIYAYIATYAGGIAADLITSAYNSCLSSCDSLAIINANKQNMYVPQPPPRGVIPPVGGSRWP